MAGSVDDLSVLSVKSGVAGDRPVLDMYRTAIDCALISLNDAMTIRDILDAAWFAHDSRAEAPGPAVEPPSALYALMIAMFACRNQGCMCLPLDFDVLRTEFSGFCGEMGDDLARQALELASIPHAFLTGDGGPWPLAIESGRLYFDRNLRSERSLKGRISALLVPDGFVPACGDPVAGQLVGRVSRYAADGIPCDLNDQQKLGVFLALRRHFVVVSGGPGTGKTRMLASLVRAFAAAGVPAGQMLLTAPTGRAARRMSESISSALVQTVDADSPEVTDSIQGLSGHTIHSALRINPSTGTAWFGPFNRLPHRLIVCDEVSMVDVSLMDRLLSAVRDDATVVFLGDRDQLPSVDAGAVLGDLVPSMATPVYSQQTIDAAAAAGIAIDSPCPGGGGMADAVVVLKKSYRSSGRVLDLAARVNAGEFDALSSAYSAGYAAASEVADWGMPGAMCRGIEPPKPLNAGLQRLVSSWVSWLYRDLPGIDMSADTDLRLLFRRISALCRTDDGAGPECRRFVEELPSILDRGRILCALRDGPLGATGINLAVQALSGASSGFFPGCPIMVTRNAPDFDLFNGDTGVVVRTGQGLCGLFHAGDGMVSVPVHGVVSVVPAFAVTVHKSQGSEYDNVLVIMPEQPDHPLCTREILYTAMTRARNNVWFLARPDGLVHAIGRRTSRYSGIDLWS